MTRGEFYEAACIYCQHYSATMKLGYSSAKYQREVNGSKLHLIGFAVQIIYDQYQTPDLTWMQDKKNFADMLGLELLVGTHQRDTLEPRHE